MEVTLQQIISKGACKGDIEKFSILFGEVANLNIETCVQHHHDLALWWNWVAFQFLPHSTWEKYHDTIKYIQKIGIMGEPYELVQATLVGLLANWKE